jgi:hypothetical protein
MKISGEEKAHWYNLKAEPVYEMPCSTKDGTRAVRKTDVEKLNLVPSITTILNLYPKPDLTRWKINKHIDSALTLPIIENESLDDFKKRIFEDAGKESENAALLGTDIHNLCENYVRGIKKEEFVVLNKYPELKEGVSNWLKQHKFEGVAELALASRNYKMAGKIDFQGKFDGIMTILDYKTQGTKPGKPINIYDTWGCQLSGYKLINPTEYQRYLNVVISSTEPGRIELVEWPLRAIEKFSRLMELFREVFQIIEFECNFFCSDCRDRSCTKREEYKK